jgi:hypothetical protein
MVSTKSGLRMEKAISAGVDSAGDRFLVAIWTDPKFPRGGCWEQTVFSGHLVSNVPQEIDALIDAFIRASR